MNTPVQDILFHIRKQNILSHDDIITFYGHSFEYPLHLR
jgi:hypothetical protein